MADFVVTATRLYRVVDGKRVRHFRGDKISGLSKADVERFTRANAIAPAKDEEAKAALEAAAAGTEGGHPSEASVAPEPPALPAASDLVAVANSGGPPPERPKNSASTEAWREYAVNSRQLSPEQAGERSRDELREQLK